MVGTVYQLADDILDTREEPRAGKTLGTDAARGIVSAAQLGQDALNGQLEDLLKNARRELRNEHEALEGLNTYLDLDLQPAVDKLLG